MLAFVTGCAAIQACAGSGDDGPPPLPTAPAAPPLPGRIVDIDPTTGTADLIVEVAPQAPSAVNGVTYEQAARAYIEKNKAVLGLTDPSKELALDEVAVAPDNTAAVHFRQMEGGYPVDDAILSVWFRADASIAMVSGPVAPDAAKAVVAPTVDSRTAVSTGEARVMSSVGAYDPKLLASPPAPRLVLRRNGKGAVLAWRFELVGTTTNGAYGMRFHVDAVTGNVVDVLDLNTPLQAMGTGVQGDTKSFEARDFGAGNPGGRYAMYQGGVGGSGGRERIVTWAWSSDAAGNNLSTLETSDDLATWDRVAVGPGAAVDGHFYTAAADQFYRGVGYASYDGRGSPMNVLVHDNRIVTDAQGNQYSMAENAFWDHGNTLHFGDGTAPQGKGDVRPTSVAWDIVVHELTHGVTQYSGDLAYANETGAMNEAMSDIMASIAELEYTPLGHTPFIIGEAAWTTTFGLRDMAHPGARNVEGVGPFPDHYSHAYSGDWDHGGVHFNSSIINNTWYLMGEGGTNDTSQIPMKTHLSRADSKRLWWRTERWGLRGQPSFDQAARRQIGWAKTQGLPLEAVACAWVATGVVDVEYVQKNYGVKCYCAKDDGGVASYDDLACCDAGTSDECCKPCFDAATDDDGGGPDDGGAPTKIEVFDSCKGRNDGVYCSQLAAYSAIVCQGETIVSGQQCANMANCTGPNGAGTQVECEGQAPPPPPDAGDAGGPMGDTCAGRADGVYCSIAAPYSAYLCKDGSTAGGFVCSSGKTCAGPNGPGTDIVCQ